MNQFDRKLRSEYLSAVIASTLHKVQPRARTGLDIGSGEGLLVELLARRTGIQFIGIEPHLEGKAKGPGGVVLGKAWARDLPFKNWSFDAVTLTSVFEHITPQDRSSSMREIYRVLSPGGVLVGQLPNMYFPIELHSHLPLQQFLPSVLGDWYCRLFSPVSWKKKGTNWFRVTPSQMARHAERAGFRETDICRFNYPRTVLDTPLRKFYGVLSIVPMGYVFSFRKPFTA